MLQSHRLALLLSITFIIQVSQQLLAQSVPIGVNQIDSKNRRQGSWVIWFDREFKPVDKQEDVHYYRLISYRDDIPIGEFSDHFRNGAVQCKGKLVQDRPDDIYDGLITWYREDGSKEQEAVFDHGELKGDIRVFSSDGKPITASFQDLNALGIQSSERGNFDAACRYYEDATYSHRN